MKKKLFSIIMLIALVVATAVTSFATSDSYSKGGEEEKEWALRGSSQTLNASGYAHRDYDLYNTLLSTQLRAYGTTDPIYARARTYVYNQTTFTQYCTSYVEECDAYPNGTIYNSSNYAKSVSPGSYVTTDISRDYADYNLVYHHWGSRYNASSAGGANSYSLAVTLHYVVRQY